MDMVSLNITGGILVSICRDMGVTLMRTSYSTIFSESLDFTCGLALPTGCAQTVGLRHRGWGRDL